MSQALSHDIIDNNLYVDRYVRGDLDEHEQRQFEEHFATCTLCMDQIELAEAFMRDFRKAATAGLIAPPATSAPRRKRQAAAWVGIAVAAALLLVFSPRLFKPAPTIAWQLEADVTRSAHIRSFHLPDHDLRVVLRIQVSAPFYRATLSDANGKRLAASEGQGKQIVELPPTELAAGRYQVDLEISEDGKDYTYEGEYPFVVQGD